MIHIAYHRDPFDWQACRRELVVHREGLTVGDVVREGVTYRNHVPVPGDALLRDGDHVDVFLLPEGEVLVTSLILTLISTAASYLFGLLFLPPGGAPDRDDDASGVYGWSGIRADRVEGEVIQIGIGAMRGAGQIISEYVTVFGIPSVEYYQVLISLGEGPITSLGGVMEDTPAEVPLSTEDPDNPLPERILIDGNPAENFLGVEAWVRLGTNEQTTIPGFERTPQQFDVAQTLTQEETENDTNSTILITDPFGTGDDDIWDAHGKAYTVLDTEAEAFRVLLYFRSGLYRVDGSSGNLLPASVFVQIRYREIDETGQEITSGGPNNDGWVRLAPEPQIIGQQQGGFTYQIEHPFLDPTTYAPNNPQKSAQSNGGGVGGTASGMTMTTPASLPGTWAQGQSVTGLTVEGWVAVRTNSDPSTAGPWNAIAAHHSDGVGNGWIFAIISKVYGTTIYTVPAFFAYNGTATPVSIFENQTNTTIPPLYTIEENATDTDPLQWIHLAVTYDGTGGDDRCTIYLNGQPVTTYLGPINLVGATSTTPIKVLKYDWQGQERGWRGRLDELVMYDEALSGEQILQRYNNGVGMWGTSLSSFVSGWHFEQATEGGTTTPDFGPLQNKLNITLSCTVGVEQGIVPQNAAGAIKRSRWKVEVLRTNIDSTSSRLQDDVEFKALVTFLNLGLAHPGLALLGLKIRASEQLSGSPPNITTYARYRAWPVWDGDDEDQPTFFYEWTRNPAWVIVGLLLDKQIGLGQTWTASKLVLPSFAAFSKFCDEIVWDAKARVTEGILDAQYDSTTVDGTGVQRGSVLFILELGTILPATWTDGHFRVTGFPTPADHPGQIFFDLNTDPEALGGYEIIEVSQSPTPRVKVYWDRLDEGDPWLDGALINSRIFPATLADYPVEYERGEARMELDTILDTEEYAWDQLQELASTARAVLVPVGGKLMVSWDASRPVVGLLGKRDIEPHSFRIAWESPRTRPNAVQIQFLDRDLEFERSSVGPLHGTTVGELGTATSRYELQSFFLKHVTRRSQVTRHGEYLLNVNELVIRRGGCRLSRGAVPYIVGDRVRLSHDLLPNGASGACHSQSTSTTEIVVDRQIELLTGKTYHVVWQPPESSAGAEQAAVTSPSGTYNVGDALTVAAGFSREPGRGETYTVCEDGQERSVIVSRQTLNEDLSVEVEFVEYVEELYTNRIRGAEQTQGLEAGAGFPVTTSSLPGPVQDLAVSMDQTIGGGAPLLRLSWTLDPETRQLVQAVRIWISVDGGPSTVALTMERGERAQFYVAGVREGQRVEARVQPVTAAGRFRPLAWLEARAVALRRSLGLLGAPTAPSVVWHGEHAVYAWELEDELRECVVEARLGSSWILGLPLWRSARGDTTFGPTPLWGRGTVMLRCMDRLGRYSAIAYLESEPEVPLDLSVVSLNNMTGAWQDFGDGWVIDTPAGSEPNGLLQDLQRNADGSVSFAGSALEGYYRAPNPLTDRSLQGTLEARELYLLAELDVATLLPWPVEEMTGKPGSVELGQWSPEGPANFADLTCEIQVRINTTADSGGWSAWRPYRPGTVRAVAVQWRVYFTRTSTDYDVTMTRFETEVQGPTKIITGRTPDQTFLARESHV